MRSRESNLARMGVQQLHGCDIDPEAIAWCAANIPGAFELSDVDPPLPYEKESMDVVIATSVFTHLTQGSQMRWLREMRRILTPGGLLLASVAGPDVARLGRSPRLSAHRPGSLVTHAAALRRVAELRRAGIIDGHLDERLNGIAPAGYYRMTLQTRHHTKKAWGRGFHGRRLHRPWIEWPPGSRGTATGLAVRIASVAGYIEPHRATPNRDDRPQHRGPGRRSTAVPARLIATPATGKIALGVR